MTTSLIAILNVTPDSFSDGGKYMGPAAALEAAQGFIRDGAAVIDVGAESTRPGAQPLPPGEEWDRLAPVLAAIAPLCAGSKVALSVDTRHPETARRALAAGAGWINDVSGFANPAMVEAVKEGGCRLVVMHALTIPADPQVTLPEGIDAVQALLRFGMARLAMLEEQGIARSRLIFDPGIGFGKTTEQSLTLIKRAGELQALGVPLLFGHSRKSFFNMFAQKQAVERDIMTLAASCFLAAQGVDYLRVHNMAMHEEAMRVLGALL